MDNQHYIRSGLLDGCAGIEHGFFTRNGGVSRGIFDSLNCSAYSGDTPASIAENRKRIRVALGSSTLVSLKQVHSSRVHIVEESRDFSTVIEGDGLVTRQPAVALGAMGADCAPVLFSDPHNRIIGTAHAGWKGAVNGITDAVLEVMCRMGSDLSKIHAAIGPAIQVSSYEVGQEFVDQVMQISPVDCEDCFVMCASKAHFNLPLYIERRLDAAGVIHIDRLRHDTYADETQFFSYRRACHRNESGYGRQVGAITISTESG